MSSYENIINATFKDNTTMVNKKTFTDLTSDLLIAMCRNLVSEESPAIAKSTLAHLQSYKYGSLNVTENSIDLSCSNCTYPQVLLGSHLQEAYDSWTCGSIECAGMGSVIIFVIQKH